jgi:DNA-binding PadR family transcriptional regulator
VDDSFSKLADAGLVNYYEDENGEEQFFLTAKGQEYADTMQL